MSQRIAFILAVMLTAVSVSASAGLFETPLEQASRESSTRMWRAAMDEQIRQKQELTEQITQARARFWETYPDKPGADEAQRRFEDLLRDKDSFYLQAALFGRFVDLTPDVDIDGGIREYARPEFDDWVKAAMDSGAATKSPFAPGQAYDAFTAAVNINAWEYKRYVRERNWSEFDAVHRLPVGCDTPETYGGYLYFRYKFARLPKDDPRAKSPGDNAAATFDKMVDVLGKQPVYDAVKKVMDAPKSDKGNLIVTVPRPVKIGPGGSEVDDDDVPMPDSVIGTYSIPLTALEMLLIKDDDRRYLLWLLSGRQPSQTNTNGTDPTTEWSFAECLYRRLVMAFGEKDVMEAAHLVRTAKKRMTSYTVMNPAAIGATRGTPWASFEDILARKNPKGYLRSALMFTYNANLKTPAEVDAAYKKFVSENEEDEVLEAAEQLAAARPNLTSPGELETLKKVLDGSLTFKKPPAPETLVDFPNYVMWKKFKPGAKISYATRYWKQDRLSYQMPVRSNRLIPEMQDHQAYQLQSITDEQVKLWFTQSSYDMFGHLKPASDSEVAYPAKYTPPAQQRPPANAPTPTSNAAWGAKRTSAPEESGEEIVEINGKRIATRWRSAAYSYDPNGTDKDCTFIVKVWTSDDVPTGLIRRVEDKTCPPGPGSPYGVRFVSETFLESFDGFTLATPDPSKPVAAAYAPIPAASTPVAAAPTSAAQPQPSPAPAPVRVHPTPAPVRPEPQLTQPPSRTTRPAPSPASTGQNALVQRYRALLLRAGQAKQRLAQLNNIQTGENPDLPAAVRSARDRLDGQLQAVVTAMGKQDNVQFMQSLQSLENSVSVIEKYLGP